MVNAIQEALRGLCEHADVRGAAVVTPDGLVAASEMVEELAADVVAGLASYLMITADRSLGEGCYGPCERLTIDAEHGKVVLVALEDSYLVVLLDAFSPGHGAGGAVDAVATRLRGAARLS